MNDSDDDSEIRQEWRKVIEYNNGFWGGLRNVDIEKIQKRLEHHPMKARLINWKDESGLYGQTMLHCAIRNGRFDIARLLLEHGADVNIPNKHGHTALMDASDYRGTKAMKLLLDKGADINITGKDGRTVLMKTTSEGHVDAVRLLLNNGADIHFATEYGETALSLAIDHWRTEIVELLLAAMGESDIPANWTLIFARERIGRFNMEEFEKWMEHPKKDHFINWKNDFVQDGATMLNFALRYNRLCVAELLLEHGADVNIADKDGETALMFAASPGGDLETAKFLMDNGANVSLADNNGRTALMWASNHGQLEAAKLLIENEADVHAKDNVGKTLMHIAAENRQVDILKLLIENGADHNIKDNEGMTPLHRACWEGSLEVVQLLLGRGANASMTTTQGATPLQITSERNHPEMVWFLVRQYPGLVL